jgi:hypothetical protein
MANNFPDAAFSTSENEVLLYIDQVLAFTMVGQVYGMAKIEGNLVMPEGWLTTYSLTTISQDGVTGEWYATLPQPPVSLPLGYSITDVYPVLAGSGKGQSFLPVKSKRTAYRRYMPKPSGGLYKITGSKIFLEASDGGSLNGYTFYVEMAKSRTESITETLNLPDDSIEAIFMNVISKMKDRLQLPKDIIADDISAGNKSS